MTSSVLEKARLQLGGDVHPGQLACPGAADAHTSDRMLAGEVATQWSVGSALPAFSRE